ncbi:hypothetical protein CM49_00957 [Paenibacillus sp. P1XP2]|nr:hypothetical protein CM49_00957 [Paenibacillus sp. P1XP2]
MSIQNSLCSKFASILGGTAEVANGVCTVTRVRSNLQPLIQGRRTKSVLAIAAFFSFEDLDSRGNALNLGETVILQEEINPFVSALRQRGIEVTAIHNHWLLTNPVLMFIHFKSIEPPLVFAQKSAEAFRVLTTRTIRPSRSSGEHRSKGSSQGNLSRGRCYGTNRPRRSGVQSRTRTTQRPRVVNRSLVTKPPLKALAFSYSSPKPKKEPACRPAPFLFNSSIFSRRCGFPFSD